MCGIFGFSGAHPVDVIRLQWLCYANEVRGDDSTGVYGQKLARSIEPAHAFINQPAFVEAVDGARLVLGHTRAATRGAVIEANAHPFIRELNNTVVVGTHNGVIPDWELRALSTKTNLPIPAVDSMMIYDYLLTHNMDYQRLADIQGSMALAFTVPDTPVLYLYHRKDRPLYYGFRSEGMYYSSESGPLVAIGCTDVKAVPVDTVVGFKEGVQVWDTYVKPPAEQSALPYGGNWRSKYNSRAWDKYYDDDLPDFRSTDSGSIIYGTLDVDFGRIVAPFVGAVVRLSHNGLVRSVVGVDGMFGLRLSPDDAGKQVDILVSTGFAPKDTLAKFNVYVPKFQSSVMFAHITVSLDGQNHKIKITEYRELTPDVERRLSALPCLQESVNRLNEQRFAQCLSKHGAKRVWKALRDKQMKNLYQQIKY